MPTAVSDVKVTGSRGIGTGESTIIVADDAGDILSPGVIPVAAGARRTAVAVDEGQVLTRVGAAGESVRALTINDEWTFGPGDCSSAGAPVRSPRPCIAP